MATAFGRALAALFLPPLLFVSLAAMQDLPVSRGPMSIEVEVKHAPAIARAGGERFLVYELHITNFVPNRAMRIGAVDVIDDATGAKLFRVEGARLADSARFAVPPPEAPSDLSLGGGQRVILFLWIPLPGSRPVAAVRHEVELTLEGLERLYRIDTRVVMVSKRPPRLVSSPVRGGDWVAANGPNPASVPDHNQLLYPSEGRILMPQRYATDWVRLTSEGRQYRGAIGVNANHSAYGQPILAVADGIVVEILNDVPDNVPPEPNPQLSQAQRAGNYVILDIGEGDFAFYGHLQPGSVSVKAGQRVRRGEALARIGNSGNSTGPHLHFHITDRPSLASEGVAFLFDDYEDLGPLGITLDELEAGRTWRRGGAGRRAHGDLPLGGRVIRFP